MRLSELSEHLRIAPRSTTEVVDALQERGLVQREPDPHDRRATLVRLTDRGNEIATAIRATRDAGAEGLLRPPPAPGPRRAGPHPPLPPRLAQPRPRPVPPHRTHPTPLAHRFSSSRTSTNVCVGYGACVRVTAAGGAGRAAAGMAWDARVWPRAVTCPAPRRVGSGPRWPC